jgi:hypothetical protein
LIINPVAGIDKSEIVKQLHFFADKEGSNFALYTTGIDDIAKIKVAMTH